MGSKQWIIISKKWTKSVIAMTALPGFKTVKSIATVVTERIMHNNNFTDDFLCWSNRSFYEGTFA